ncbi:DeoR family transcriptional regulator [Oceanisphaera sp. W20_SRM_FM3]|uniref:DeoR family transcriptional regulator n=1 Tax=Oceanisphaera sp. W20_SRM_FM3 TaxID=3240267 RepID=UPI003F9CDE86
MPFNYQQVTTHFGHIYPAHVEELCELLIVLRKQFFGDLDLMLILAIIGSRTLPARQSTAMTYQEFMANDKDVVQVQAINIQSVAECSGIARETVRRKIQKLETLGLVVRDEQGMLSVTAKAATNLSDSTEASLQYLAALGDTYLAASREASLLKHSE